MDGLLQHKEYIADIKKCASDSLIPWEELSGKTILISGATGMIASTLIDILMYRNRVYKGNIHILAFSRNAESAGRRFAAYAEDKSFTYFSHDVTEPFREEIKADYIIHAASNTHPVAYATDPVGTILTNVEGTKNLLELAKKSSCKRFVLLSTVEVYGDARDGAARFDESYSGYIDCNTVRAGYPESKRLSEALCNAYQAVHGIDFVTARLARIYGPTALQSDSKAIFQFIRKAAEKENIVLKSDGSRRFSYAYVADTAMGILTLMLLGESGQAYNVSDKDSEVSLRELAEMLADIAGTKVVFELPEGVEASGYSKGANALMDSGKLERLGWKAKVHLKEGLEKTVQIFRKKD